MGDNKYPVTVTINGSTYEREVEARLLLSDFIRHELRLTGTHVGCEHGVCGACTVLLDGQAVRACLIFTVQANGRQITTVEGLAGPEGGLSVLQDSFWECHGLQCGYCTPGMLISAHALLEANRTPSEDDIRAAIGGNLCRCTGYVQIIEAVKLAAERMEKGAT